MRHVAGNPWAVPATFVEAGQRRLFIAGDRRSASGKWFTSGRYGGLDGSSRGASSTGAPLCRHARASNMFAVAAANSNLRNPYPVTVAVTKRQCVALRD